MAWNLDIPLRSPGTGFDISLTSTVVVSISGSSYGVATQTGVLDGNTLPGEISGEIYGLATTEAVLRGRTYFLYGIVGYENYNYIATLIGRTRLISLEPAGNTYTEGILTVRSPIIGQSNGIATTSGQLNVGSSISQIIGETTCLITTNGVIHGRISISGSSTEVVTTNGLIQGKISISGQSTEVVTANGVIRGRTNIIAESTESIIISGVIHGRTSIIGESTETVTTNGIILGRISISGSSTEVVISLGIIFGYFRIIGESTEVVTTSALISGIIQRFGQVNAFASTSGDLTGRLQPPGELIGSSIVSPDISYSLLIGTGRISGESTSLPTTSGLINVLINMNINTSRASTVNPQVIASSISFISNILNVIGRTVEPVLSLTSIYYFPIFRSLIGRTSDPVVLSSTVNISPSVRNVVTRTINPNIYIDSGLLEIVPMPINTIGRTIFNNIVFSSVSVDGITTNAITETNDPFIFIVDNTGGLTTKIFELDPLMSVSFLDQISGIPVLSLTNATIRKVGDKYAYCKTAPNLNSFLGLNLNLVSGTTYCATFLISLNIMSYGSGAIGLITFGLRSILEFINDNTLRVYSQTSFEDITISRNQLLAISIKLENHESGRTAIIINGINYATNILDFGINENVNSAIINLGGVNQEMFLHYFSVLQGTPTSISIQRLHDELLHSKSPIQTIRQDDVFFDDFYYYQPGKGLLGLSEWSGSFSSIILEQNILKKKYLNLKASNNMSTYLKNSYGMWTFLKLYWTGNLSIKICKIGEVFYELVLNTDRSVEFRRMQNGISSVMYLSNPGYFPDEYYDFVIERLGENPISEFNKSISGIKGDFCIWYKPHNNNMWMTLFIRINDDIIQDGMNISLSTDNDVFVNSIMFKKPKIETSHYLYDDTYLSDTTYLYDY